MLGYINLVQVKRHSDPFSGCGTFFGTFCGNTNVTDFVTFFVSQLHIINGKHHDYVVQYIKMAFRVTKEQKNVLEAKARAEGYTKVAFYIRAVLLKTMTTEEKINAIYEKICRNK